MTKIGTTQGDAQPTNDDNATGHPTGYPADQAGAVGPGSRPARTRADLMPVVERYAAARAATAMLTSARGADAPPDARGRHELMVGALVALLDSVGDVPVLLRELHTTRLRAADLTAAGRATLAADRDGEADPLFYLRDELSYQAGNPADSEDLADDPADAPAGTRAGRFGGGAW